MKTLILPLLVVVPVAQAQVVRCPKFYPWRDTPLAEVPYQHRGQGFVAKAKLNGAGMYTGEVNGQGELVGDERKVKGGWDVRHGFASGERKWLVCTYGTGDITWWEELDPKVTSCLLQTRDGGSGPMDVRLECKSGKG